MAFVRDHPNYDKRKFNDRFMDLIRRVDEDCLTHKERHAYRKALATYDHEEVRRRFPELAQRDKLPQLLRNWACRDIVVREMDGW